MIRTIITRITICGRLNYRIVILCEHKAHRSIQPAIITITKENDENDLLMYEI
jgi:hypothetical protein